MNRCCRHYQRGGLTLLLMIKNKCNILFFFLKKLRPRNEQRENELIISFLRCLYEEKQKVHIHIGEIKQVWQFLSYNFIRTLCKRVLRILWSSETSFCPRILFSFVTHVRKIWECAWRRYKVSFYVVVGMKLWQKVLHIRNEVEE